MQFEENKNQNNSRLLLFISPFIAHKQRLFDKRTYGKLRLCRSTNQGPNSNLHLPMATLASDEVSEVIAANPELGEVTSIARAGSSGWAVMHQATTKLGKRLFIKVSREDASMFKGEAIGLDAMFQTQTIRVPRVYHHGSLNSVTGSFIVMEALPLQGIYDQKNFGRDLARLHLAEPNQPEAKNGRFGFAVDNTIGATHQPNEWMDNWIEFFRERRLRHQFKLTGDGNLIRLGNQLCDSLDDFFEDVKDDLRPSLLHGDLWGGNVKGINTSAVIFDPACYYGHHEAEFGMSWCLDLSEAFWEGYRELIPKAGGFDNRKKLYTLYHYLNHYNLFGGGYYQMASIIVSDLLRSAT